MLIKLWYLDIVYFTARIAGLSEFYFYETCFFLEGGSPKKLPFYGGGMRRELLTEGGGGGACKLLMTIQEIPVAS